MEKCESPPARFKRKAWAQSRDSWQASGCHDQDAKEVVDDQTATSPQTGQNPSQVENWLKTCRTPLGASLDEQSASPSRGPLKNGCSFEDDLSLGAEANHLQRSNTKAEANNFEMHAKAKRSQFKQKGRSMNSTGSGKSSTTVSSVSELLDLYEEDPEEILYNLGFGQEEPDIASKIPSRFFKSSSGRFRQTEVLATVANVFSEIYSQVSGRPTEKFGNGEAEPKLPAPLKKSNSALNVAKILKRNITKQNLLASAPEEDTKLSLSPENENSELRDGSLSKISRKKDSSLATVTEEAQPSISDASLNGDFTVMNGDHSSECIDTRLPLSPVVVSISEASEDGKLNIVSEMKEDGHHETITSTPDKEAPSLLPNPHIAHLLCQPRDSFEMEELQSNEDETLPGPGYMFRAGSERLLRTTSQQSDSSGFAEDPSTDSSGNHLKIQESSDSCDSETTVTSHAGEVSTPIALEYPSFERFQSEESQPRRGSSTQRENSQEEINGFLNPYPNLGKTSSPGGPVCPASDRASSMECGSNTDSIGLTSNTMVELNDGNVLQPSSRTEQDFSKTSQQVSSVLPEPSNPQQFPTVIQRRPMSFHLANQRSSSMDEVRPGRVWVKHSDLRESLERNPLRRSSSLPTSSQSPTRVVTSMRVQLGRGSVKHCTPLSYTYHYEEENLPDREEVESILEEDEVDTTLLKDSHSKVGTLPSEPHPLNIPQHLTRSSSSLYSVPADWPHRPFIDGPNWSTCSVPNLSQFSHVPPSQGSIYLPQYNAPYNTSFPSRLPHNSGVPHPQAHPSNTFPSPQGAGFGPQNSGHYAHPYNSYHHPYSVPQSNPYPAHNSMGQSHSTPYSMGYNGSSHQHSGPYFPSSHYPYSFGLPPAPAMGSTEMQLRRVLHDIRGTVQNLGQSSSGQGGETPVDRIHSPHSVHVIYEELQMRRRSLNVFRTQMMDLELALMRQQSMVFQHLSPEE
ncbi:hypothetical protein DNTS_029034, partial [Danionella cerebrum]